MALANDLMGVGIAGEAAMRLGFSNLAAVTAAGTTTTNATVLKKLQNAVSVTATGVDGIRLPSDAELLSPYLLFNDSGSTCVVYPSTGGTINGGASLSLADNKTAIAWRLSTNVWAAILTA